jgi:hypothetical protein
MDEKTASATASSPAPRALTREGLDALVKSLPESEQKLFKRFSPELRRALQTSLEGAAMNQLISRYVAEAERKESRAVPILRKLHDDDSYRKGIYAEIERGAGKAGGITALLARAKREVVSGYVHKLREEAANNARDGSEYTPDGKYSAENDPTGLKLYQDVLAKDHAALAPLNWLRNNKDQVTPEVRKRKEQEAKEARVEADAALDRLTGHVLSSPAHAGWVQKFMRREASRLGAYAPREIKSKDRKEEDRDFSALLDPGVVDSLRTGLAHAPQESAPGFPPGQPKGRQL